MLMTQTDIPALLVAFDWGFYSPSQSGQRLKLPLFPLPAGTAEESV
jgi:hypothetical protein